MKAFCERKRAGVDERDSVTIISRLAGLIKEPIL